MSDGQAGRQDGLVVSGLTVAAGGRTLLWGVSFEVARGEILGLTGPSGHGKTTLLRAIAGLDRPQAGEVRLGAERPEALGWTRYRRRVVFVPERPAFVDASVLENLERPFSYRVARGAFVESEALALLEAIGLSPRLGLQPARSLSAGEQRRVALVRALLVEPDFLLLDEPTGALDSDATARVAQVLKAKKRVGCGAILVSHDEALVAGLCERRLRTADLVRDLGLDSAAIRREARP